MINNNRLATTANAFIGALAIARNEAIKRGKKIIVLAKKKDKNNEWGGGWVVVDADDNIIRDFSLLGKQNITLNSNNDISEIIFNARGFLSEPLIQDIIEIKMPGSINSRLITITASGVTRVEKK
ncbi:GspH/FimT family protein [Spartinivicinus sp. SM1973]|nr:GspH/FimT family protein [Spartinivicinus marinus]